MWPHERSLVKNLENQPFALIGVNVMGYEPEQLKKVMEKEKLTWRSYTDYPPQGTSYGPIATQWNLSGTPTLFVLDHKGVIRHRWLGSPGDKKIDEALDKLIKEAEEDGKKAPR
jgi:hypothetical protein